MRKTLLCMVAFFAILLSCISTFAQETTSEMAGSVSDGKTPLAGATITATHLPTGTKYTTVARKDGRFNLPNLRVGGPYTIKVSSVGFKDELQEGIVLSLGQVYTFDYTLKTSAQDLAAVVVTGTKQSNVFNSGHTGSQEVISNAQINRLPTINRSIQDFTKLEPTANGSNFGGRSSQYNNITVDGANFNNGFGLSSTLGGQTGAQPISLDAIDQIQVNVSPYDVRQGGFTGAGVNAVTKAGTNQFKGDVYTYIKGPGTQGYKVEDATIAKSPFSYYTRGASLGGAIVKNKLFFFVNYEKVKQTAPAFNVVASSASQAPLAGSVSQANFDTLTLLANTLKSKYGYDPGSFQGYSFSSQSTKVTARLDWNINSKNVLTLKYNNLRSFTESPQSTSRTGAGTTAAGVSGNFITGPAAQSYTYGLPFSGSKYIINNNFDIYLAELNTRFSSHLSNKFQAGYTKERDPRAPGVAGSTIPMVDILNGTGNTYGSQVYTSFGYETYTYNNLINTDVYQLSDIATLYKGKHEITFGTQDYYRKYADAFVPNFAGGYQFPSMTAFYNAINGVGIPQDKYYQAWSNIPGGAFPFYYAGSTELGFFVQDKWRATNNFTLTYGLRYDMTIYKQDFLDNPNFDALAFKNGQSYNIGQAPGNAKLLSPRVGFNWDVKGDKTLQVRGGAGWFTGPPPFVWLANQGGNNGVLIASNNYTNAAFTTNAITNPPVYYGVGTGTTPMQVNTAPPAKLSSANSYGAAVTSKNFKYPTVIKTNLAVDKKFGDGWVATIEGSFSKDVNAVYFSNINLNESNGFALATPSNSTTGGDNRTRYLNPIAFTATPTSTSSNAYYNRGTDPDHPNISTAILMDNTSKGYAYTLTARIQRTYNNLYVSAAYTHSSSKNVAVGGSTASSIWNGRYVGNADPNSPNLAYSEFYQPDRVIATANYRVAYGKCASTSIGLIYEAAPAGVGNYRYNGDLNGDGQTNDLIYIPKNANEINLVPVGSGGTGVYSATYTGTKDTRTAGQTWNQLNNFITQDHYLNSHRGQYAQANAVVLPFFSHLDMNVTQNVYFTTKNGSEITRHTLQFEFNLINVGNFLNQNWGLLKQQTTNTPLTFEGMAADGKTPSFSMPYIDAANQVPLVNSFSNNTSISSRWQMQFGFKYLFN